MAVYRTVHLSFWLDAKVDDDFTPEDKYFFLYLLTNPHTNICGCYEIGEKQFCRETGYNTETINRLLRRFEYAHDVIRYNAKTKEVLILNWYKYNWTSSDDLKKAVRKVAQTIKSDVFRDYVLTRLDDSSNTVIRPSIDTVGTSVTDTVSASDAITDTVSIQRKRSSKETYSDDVKNLFGYNEFLMNAVVDWLTYKKEKKQSYHEIGLKSLLTRIQNSVSEYGEDVVINLIRDSMAANYTGITWDKLKQQRKQASNTTQSYSFMDIVRREEKNEQNGNGKDFSSLAV